MRGETVLILLVLLLTGATSTHHQGDDIELDSVTFTIGRIYENATEIIIDGEGSLWREDDCHSTTNHILCLRSILENSTTIEITNRTYNITLRRTAPEDLIIGEEYEVELTIANNANEDIEVTLKEHNPHIIENSDDGEWTETISIGRTKTVKYTAVADHPGEAWLNASAQGGGYTATNNHSIQVDDFITIETDYTSNSSSHATYPFRLAITSEEADVEAEVILTPYEGLQVEDLKNWSLKDGKLQSAKSINGTSTYSFDYRASVPGEAILQVITERNQTASRTYHIPFHAIEFTPLIVIHDNNDRTVPINETTTLTYQIHNPNQMRVIADTRFSSILYTDEQTHTIGPNQTVTLQAPVTVNNTKSQYSMRLDISYEDPKGDAINQTEFSRITGTIEQSAEPEPVPTLRLSGPDSIEENQTAQLIIALENTDGNATLHLTRDGELVVEQALTNETVFTITTPGRYHASVNLNGKTLNASHTISQPQRPAIQEQTERSFPWTVLIGALITTLGAAVITYPQLQRRRLEELRAAIEEKHERLSQNKEYLRTMYPRNNEELLQQRMREEESQSIMAELPRLRARLARLEQQAINKRAAPGEDR